MVVTVLMLKPGDGVALVAPAGQVRTADRPLVDDAVALLEGWGLRVSRGVESDNHFYLAGADDKRTAHFRAALSDPELRAVFCTRGGYGSARLWPALRHADVASPRLLVGFSDITSLHLMAEQCWPEIECVHGPNLATAQMHGDHAAQNRAALHRALFAWQPETVALQTVVPGRARGRLVGGCLSLIAAAMGTPYQLDADGGIVLLEDTGEAPYRIDRMLVHLRNAGLFDTAAGVVLGTMPGCVDPYNDLLEIVSELMTPVGLPVLAGLATGHGDRNLAVRLNRVVELDGDRATIRLG
ncbi:MAG: LD-carboxypeptidase [Pseudomonadota bacterium]